MLTSLPQSSLFLNQVTSLAKERILGQTQHPNSVARIQEIEAPKPAPEEAPDAAKVVRFFYVHLSLI